MDITVNPLHTIVSVGRPKWMCRHVGARLLDAKKFIYECLTCNPTTGTITVIPTYANKASSRTPTP